MIELKTPREIEKIRVSARTVAECHEIVKGMIAPGMTTRKIDKEVEKYIRDKGGRPSFLGYRDFPATICASINDAVVHGIPNDTPLQEGDVVSIDIGVYKDGFHGDAARTYGVGKIADDVAKLLQVTEEALMAAVDQVRPGNTLLDIARTIQGYGDKHGYGVVREYVGHGIGRKLHEEPQVPNYVNPFIEKVVFQPGLVLAIEPMFNLGTEKVKTLSDQWTVVTVDGKASAHFEHDVAVTEDGPYLLSVL